MKYILTIILTFIVFTLFSQVVLETLDMNGKNNVQIKKISKHPKLTIRIDSFEIGDKMFAVNFQYKGKIKDQTGLLKITDSIAINVIFLKLKIQNKDEFIYSFTFYRKGDEDSWKEISALQFYTLIPGSYTDGWGGIGYRGDTDCFWYKMYLKFE